jgi:hypothetical protein
MKPTAEQLHLAIVRLSMCRYFPADEATRAAIMVELSDLCGTAEQLAWLVDTMVKRVGTWEGPAEMRGVFCTRFPPADGVQVNSTLPGFSPADLEKRSYELHEAIKQAGALPEPSTADRELQAAMTALVRTRKKL